jgi:hypothetical protein
LRLWFLAERLATTMSKQSDWIVRVDCAAFDETLCRDALGAVDILIDHSGLTPARQSPNGPGWLELRLEAKDETDARSRAARNLDACGAECTITDAYLAPRDEVL